MKTGQPWFSKINSLFKVKTLNDDIWDDLEEALILSDVGVPIASGLIDNVRSQVQTNVIDDPAEVFEVLKSEVKALLSHDLDYSALINTFQPSSSNNPIVILLCLFLSLGLVVSIGIFSHFQIKRRMETHEVDSII